MAISVNNNYGSYEESRPIYINAYGDLTDKYGVIYDPYAYSAILLEDGSYLLQEDGSVLLQG